MSKSDYAYDPQRGATFIETAITFPIFILALLLLFDALRLFLVYVMLSVGVNTAVQEAAKSDLDMKTDAASCNANAQAQQACAEYATRISTILDKVESYSSLVSGLSGSAMTQRHTFLHYMTPGDAQSNSSPLGFGAKGALFLRPGEIARRDDGTLVSHPTLGASGFPTASSFTTWPLVYATHPLYARADADFTFLLPFVPRLSLEVTAFAYRKSPNSARPPRNQTSAPLTVTPTPLETNTPTPTGSPTPTPDCSCCPTSCPDSRCDRPSVDGGCSGASTGS